MAHYDYGGGGEVKNTKKYDYVICKRSLIIEREVIIEKMEVEGSCQFLQLYFFRYVNVTPNIIMLITWQLFITNKHWDVCLYQTSTILQAKNPLSV